MLVRAANAAQRGCRDVQPVLRAAGPAARRAQGRAWLSVRPQAETTTRSSGASSRSVSAAATLASTASQSCTRPTTCARAPGRVGPRLPLLGRGRGRGCTQARPCRQLLPLFRELRWLPSARWLTRRGRTGRLRDPGAARAWWLGSSASARPSVTATSSPPRLTDTAPAAIWCRPG